MQALPAFGENAGTPGSEPLNRPYRVTIASDRSAIVLDWFAPHVRVYGQDGRLSAAFAPAGDAPGQLHWAPYFAYEESPQAVAVWEMVGRRLLRFGTRGEHVGSVDMPYVDPVSATTTGNDAYVIGKLDTPGKFDVLRLQPGTHAVESIFQIDTEHLFGKPAVGVEVVVGPERTFAVAALGGDYRLLRLDRDGNAIGQIGRDGVPRARKSAERLAKERDAARALARSRGVELPSSSEDFHFYLMSTRVDDMDRLWILTSRGRNDSISVFDVFAWTTGEYLGEASIPGYIETSNYSVLGNRLVAAIAREDGGEYVLEAWQVVEEE